jgi:hypothetical protein
MKPSWHKSGHSAMSDRFGGKDGVIGRRLVDS